MASARGDAQAIVQVAVPAELKADLDLISSKTHVAKSVIIRMGLENVINDIKTGKIQLGIRFAP